MVVSLFLLIYDVDIEEIGILRLCVSRQFHRRRSVLSKALPLRYASP